MKLAVFNRRGVKVVQLGFFDQLDRFASQDTKRDPLVAIDAIVSWVEFRAVLERI